MTLESAIKHAEEVAQRERKRLGFYQEHNMPEYFKSCKECEEEYLQLAEWLKELKRYRKQIQNLIDNESFEIVNPFNTYEYARVVRVADLYDLMEVNADGDR